MKKKKGNKKKVKTRSSVLMAVRRYQFGDLLGTFIFYAGLVFILFCFVFGLVSAKDYKNPLTGYERINCLKYEQVYEEIFIPALGEKKLTKVNRCVEYEVFE